MHEGDLILHNGFMSLDRLQRQKGDKSSKCSQEHSTWPEYSNESISWVPFYSLSWNSRFLITLLSLGVIDPKLACRNPAINFKLHAGLNLP